LSYAAGVQTLVLVRHGATNWNASSFCQGHKDVPLNETGRRQIGLLADALGDYDFDRAFASPLQRAQETCRIIGPEPVVLEDLIEIDRGHWEGHEMDEIRRRWGQLVKQWYDDPAGLTMPGGEAFDDLWDRAGRLERELDGPGVTLACAHKAINRVLIARLLRRPTRGVWQIPAPQGSCSILVKENGEWRAEKIGDVSYLPEELRSDS
jgi:broad specificity phosphatase PhoE